MENKNQFTLIDEEGKEVVYDVLFTFDSEETNKSYIVYTDNSTDEEIFKFMLVLTKKEKELLPNLTQLKPIKNGK